MVCFDSLIFSEEVETLESTTAANLLITFLLDMTVNFLSLSFIA